jgi:hypothetical protein
MTPADSEDLTHVIEEQGDEYVVLWSPETAEHRPEYCELASFRTRAQAERYLTIG